MNRKNREILKSYFLILLAITAFIQVGILWYYQNHGLPFNFITAIFHSMNPGADQYASKKDFFTPYRLIVSGGSEQSHWAVDKNSEYYDAIWLEANIYLKEILKKNEVEVRDMDEAWGAAVTKRAFVIEFRTTIPQEILAWFLDITGVSSNAPSGVYKIAILPWEEDINNLNTIYILDGKKVYRYVLPFNSKGLPKDSYEKIIGSYESGMGAKGYSIAKDYLDKTKSSTKSDLYKADFVRKDLLFSVTGVEEIGKLQSSVPGYFSNVRKSEDIRLIEDAVLGQDKDSFDSPSSEVQYPIVFKNVNNIYRIYQDGLLEYKYLSTTEENGKSTVKDAFEKALEFIGAKKKNLADGIDQIQLSGIREVGNDFEFAFDYIVDGQPVFFDYKTRDNKEEMANNALLIRANDKRVVECWWAVRKFDRIKDNAGKYNVRFPTFLDSLFDKHKGLDKKGRNFFIDDVNIAYKVNMNVTKSETLNPVWIAKILDENGAAAYYQVDMVPGK